MRADERWWYLSVGFFISCFSFTPVTGPEKPDLLVSPGEAHRHDGALDPAKAKVTLLLAAVIEVFGDHAQRVQKRMLGELKPDAMLGRLALSFAASHSKSGIGLEPMSGMYNLPYFCMAEKPRSSGGPGIRPARQTSAATQYALL